LVRWVLVSHGGAEMKLAYTPVPVLHPVPSLGGGRIRHRPMGLLRVTGPAGGVIRGVLFDSGADDVVFPDVIAPTLGIDLTTSPQITIHLVGRGPFPCRFARVTLWLSDRLGGAYEWEAVVGFVPVPNFTPLLGHAGFVTAQRLSRSCAGPGKMKT